MIHINDTIQATNYRLQFSQILDRAIVEWQIHTTENKVVTFRDRTSNGSYPGTGGKDYTQQ